MEVIIADDDTAAISNIQRNQDPGLKKYSYKNYIKQNISESRHCLSIHLQIVVIIREGDSYKSEMVFYNTDTCITYIPEPTTKPAPQPPTFSQNTPLVYFDLEKTGLGGLLMQSA